MKHINIVSGQAYTSYFSVKIYLTCSKRRALKGWDLTTKIIFCSWSLTESLKLFCKIILSIPSVPFRIPVSVPADYNTYLRHFYCIQENVGVMPQTLLLYTVVHYSRLLTSNIPRWIASHGHQYKLSHGRQTYKKTVLVFVFAHSYRREGFSFYSLNKYRSFTLKIKFLFFGSRSCGFLNNFFFRE
jgi:hypothetical protein